MRLERALDARNCIIAQRCPSNISLQCSIISVLQEFLALAFLFTRTNLWKGNTSTGVISFFLESQNWWWALALHASHVALFYVVETTRACIFLNMLIYTITYSSCFFLFFFFLCRMEEGIGGTGLDTPCQLFRIFK